MFNLGQVMVKHQPLVEGIWGWIYIHIYIYTAYVHTNTSTLRISAKWMIGGDTKKPLRVPKEPLGGCWCINKCPPGEQNNYPHPKYVWKMI